MFKELRTTFNSSQNIRTFVQWKNRWSMASNSFWQKPHKGESTFLNLNSIFFVYKILVKILCWNSLNLVSNVVFKGSRYIFSQSSRDVCMLKASLYFFCVVGTLDILATKLSYNDFKILEIDFLPFNT